MRRSGLRSILYTLVLIFIPFTPLLAHPNPLIEVHQQGFLEGFFHPFLGFDHLITMLSIGFLASRYEHQHQAFAQMSLCFLSLMIIASVIIHQTHFALSSFIEILIAIGLMMSGLMMVISAKMRLSNLLILLGVMGALHGAAHAEAMSNNLFPIGFVAGFTLATLTIMLIGFLIVSFWQKNNFIHQHGRQLFGLTMVVSGAAKLVLS